MKAPAKIVLIVAAVIVGLVLIGIFALVLTGPRKADFAHLVEPRIVQKEDTRALMTDFDGDPNVVISEAFARLMGFYYRLKGVPKGPGQRAPLARYEDIETLVTSMAMPSENPIPWRGFVAIPVPEVVQSLPEDSHQGPYPLRLQRLEYGTVAEIVHFGPYEDEAPTIQRILRYIDAQGYEIAGLHEEEYIRGPGLPLVTPRRYITIIRYRVRPR